MPEVDWRAWAVTNADAFADTSKHVTFHDRDASLIEWTLIRLANEDTPGAAEIVRMLTYRHGA